MDAAAGGGHFIRPGRLPCGAVGAARALIKYNPKKRTPGHVKYNPYGSPAASLRGGGERHHRHHPWRGFRIRTSSGTQSPVYSSDQTGPNGGTTTAPDVKPIHVLTLASLYVNSWRLPGASQWI